MKSGKIAKTIPIFSFQANKSPQCFVLKEYLVYF